MICDYCNTETVTWRGPMSALTHTECSRCGRTNCQRVDAIDEDEFDDGAPGGSDDCDCGEDTCVCAR